MNFVRKIVNFTQQHKKLVIDVDVRHVMCCLDSSPSSSVDNECLWPIYERNIAAFITLLIFFYFGLADAWHVVLNLQSIRLLLVTRVYSTRPIYLRANLNWPELTKAALDMWNCIARNQMKHTHRHQLFPILKVNFPYLSTHVVSRTIGNMFICVRTLIDRVNR